MDLGIVSNAVAGMQNASMAMNNASGRIAQAGAGMDLIEPMVTMATQQPVYAANAEVIAAYDDVVGTLLDTTA